MALMGIGSNYLSQLPNESIPDSKMENTGKGKVHNAIQDEGVRYEKTISDSVSAGLAFIQGIEKQLSGTDLW